MKKSLTAVAVITGLFSFAAFSFIHGEEPEKESVQKELKCEIIDSRNPISKLKERESFYLGVRPRFFHTLTKEYLTTVKELEDLLPKDAPKLADKFYNVKLGIFQDEEEVTEESINQFFNEKQLELLSSVDYSGNIHVYGNFKVENNDGSSREDYVSYYITVTPETEAELEGGIELISEFIRKNSKREISSVRVDKLKPGKIEFAVSETGAMENFKLLESSGNKKIDSKIMKSLREFEGHWTPALNADGEKIEQRFVLSFGLQGC